ncbi:MAG TPA: hypothetical protein VMH85_02650, partial [Terriglobales bacterium]|nr:hypothetical protein [Terriglobales bacterium]
MKDVRITTGPPVARVPLVVPGEPLKGWALRYESGIDVPEIRAGYWLAKWSKTDSEISFDFSQGLNFAFDNEAEARNAMANLREHAIHTRVVKLV